MILVYGGDDAFVDEVITHLRASAHDALRIPTDAHLFSEVVSHRAETVIGLTARCQPGSDSEDRELVEALIAASNAPSSPRIVLVTPGPFEGPDVAALKRSGASYVVISSLGVRDFSMRSPGGGRTVWVSSRLLEPEHSIVTKSALLCTLAMAVADETGTGIELRPSSSSWRDALREAGVRVVAVPNWLARLAYLCSVPAVFLAAGRAQAHLGDEEPVPLQGLLPSARAAA